MIRALVYLVGVVGSVVVMIVSKGEGTAFALASGLAVGLAVPIIDTALNNVGYLKIAYYGLRTCRSRVRVSASYLYRIKVDEKYLLIRGERFNRQYQPVGGVYKFHPSSSGRLRELGVLNDDLLLADDVSEGDLRIRVPGRLLLSFVRWFAVGRGREVDGWREFYEELVASKILPREEFGSVKYDVIRRYYHPLRFSAWAGSKELLIADILELLPTDAQLCRLRELKAHHDTRVLWATEDQMRRRGAIYDASSQNTSISETAEWTL